MQNFKMASPKFDIYEGTVAPNCFESKTNSWCPDFFSKKKVLCDVWSEITGLRKLYSGLTFWCDLVISGYLALAQLKNYDNAAGD